MPTPEPGAAQQAVEEFRRLEEARKARGRLARRGGGSDAGGALGRSPPALSIRGHRPNVRAGDHLERPRCPVG